MTWSLADRRVRSDLIKICNITHASSAISCNTIFNFCHLDRRRRQSLKLRKICVCTYLRQHFSERAINVWHKLDVGTKLHNPCTVMWMGHSQDCLCLHGSLGQASPMEGPYNVLMSYWLVSFRRLLTNYIIHNFSRNDKAGDNFSNKF